MNPGETTACSPLEKPLAELTEEDIAQLTREDCRRFLKQKGMRRPSWNKSQAIQQVISLKALLEVRPDSADAADAGNRPKPPPPVLISLPPPVKEPSPYRRRDPIPPLVYPAGDPANLRRSLANLRQSPEERAGGAAKPSVSGQMTIFYGGRVNVYDGVPAEKARAIMQIAATPNPFESPPGPVQLSRPLPTRLNPAHIGPGTASGFFATSPSGKSPQSLRDGVEGRLTREQEMEGPTGRKASLQRYLEKRKDRYKGKRVIGGSSSSGMEMMYLSQKFRAQAPYEQSSPSNTSSPTQPKPPRTPTRCSSIENRTQKFRISVDLNDDGGGN